MKTKIRNSISGLLFIPLLLTGFALLPRAQAETPAEGVTPELALPGFNTADGFNALDSLTTGVFNSGFGALTLEDNTTGSHNTALGAQALRVNTLGSFNTAVGENALVKNIDGNQNMALGQGALANNVTGDNNTAMGFQALNVNTTSGNTAVGFQAARSNTSGLRNTAVGFQALFNNTTSGNNTAYGYRALANTTGTNNIALGFNAGLNISIGSNNIDIGNPGAVFGESSTIRIGSASQSRTFIAGIRGVVPPVGVLLPVVIDLNGQLGNTVSSRRFKKEIKAMDNASEAIHALKPVTFHYKSDTTSTPQFGLIAEDVAAVNPDLVVRDENGEIYTVRYEAVNAMLLNEFLKEHRKNEEQEKTIAELKSGMTALAATVKEQASQIQKVNARLEMIRPAPQVAENKR
jgi:Chaperone of endosialidase